MAHCGEYFDAMENFEMKEEWLRVSPERLFGLVASGRLLIPSLTVCRSRSSARS